MKSNSFFGMLILLMGLAPVCAWAHDITVEQTSVEVFRAQMSQSKAAYQSSVKATQLEKKKLEQQRKAVAEAEGNEQTAKTVYASDRLAYAKSKQRLAKAWHER